MESPDFQNDPAGRSDKAISELEKQLRSIWQGWQFVVQTLDDAEFEKVDVQEIRKLLDRSIGLNTHPRSYVRLPDGSRMESAPVRSGEMGGPPP